MTEFSELASVLDSISATTKRKEKTRLIAGFLKDIHDDDIEIAALLLAGRIFAESDERTLNMSWAGILGAIQKAMEIDIKEIEKHYKGDAGEAIASVLESTNIPRQQVLYVEPLTLELVQSTIRRIALSEGKGSKSEREALLSNLLQSASPREIRYLVALFLGDMRTGVSDAMLIEGISEAFDIEGDLLRRAWSFSGDIGKVARVASFSGIEGISKIEIQLFTPIKPMLATPGDSVGEVLSDVSERYYLEMKYDGARVQIHKQYEEVRIYSRRLIEVTQSLPEIVKIVNERIKVESVILDGEIIAVNQEGVPAPFQEVMKRFGRTQEIEDAMAEVQIQLFVFDIILKDSQCLVDSDYACRRDILESTVPSELIAPRYTFSSLHEAEEFFESSKASGHEGVMIKKGSSNYIPGKRGKYWYKIKHTLPTLDMVILAAEWGHGRRSNWLSDYHLGVYDEDSGEYIMVGKTFKGLTDKELDTMTKELQDIAYESKRGLVRVRPEIVVEVIVSELQSSSTYDAGIALRFARIKRIRQDLNPKEILTLKQLEDLFNSQFDFKAR